VSPSALESVRVHGTASLASANDATDEGILRRTLFEETGGSYPELITRSDIKVFLPPIGGLTVYIFGDPAKMSDPNSRLALRVHDECNGSDVFGSDICTCRPYLTFGIEEAVKEAQKGGSGVVIYFRKEGRALGEVTKYLVYNARKRGEDRASEYFKRTENIAGVKDMRFQALMPDVSSQLIFSMLRVSLLPMRRFVHDSESWFTNSHATDSSLARYHQDRQDAQHVQVRKSFDSSSNREMADCFLA
jgi:GTP cyclohydrolase II